MRWRTKSLTKRKDPTGSPGARAAAAACCHSGAVDGSAAGGGGAWLEGVAAAVGEEGLADRWRRRRHGDPQHREAVRIPSCGFRWKARGSSSRGGPKLQFSPVRHVSAGPQFLVQDMQCGGEDSRRDSDDHVVHRPKRPRGGLRRRRPGPPLTPPENGSARGPAAAPPKTPTSIRPAQRDPLGPSHKCCEGSAKCRPGGGERTERPVRTMLRKTCPKPERRRRRLRERGREASCNKRFCRHS